MAVPVDDELRASHFTAREVEILRLVAEGLGNKEIALRLGLSRRTVATHLERLFARNGFHSRSEALAFWLKTGVGQTSDLTHADALIPSTAGRSADQQIDAAHPEG